MAIIEDDVRRIAVLENVGMIKDGGATGQSEFRAADEDACPRGLRPRFCPDLIEGTQPGKQIGVLGCGHGPCQRLVEVMMAIDETRQDNLARQIDDAVGALRQFVRRSNRFDDAIDSIKARLSQLPAGGIHGHEAVGILGEQSFVGHVTLLG